MRQSESVECFAVEEAMEEEKALLNEDHGGVWRCRCAGYWRCGESMVDVLSLAQPRCSEESR